jgi:hypothetical protein
MVFGQAKREIQPERRARATVSAVMTGIRNASGQRVKRSTAVRQYLDSADHGRGPIRSMWIFRKRAVGSVKSPMCVIVWR